MSATEEHNNTPDSLGPLSKASPPSYNDVSGAVIIDKNGKPHFLSPEEEVERQQRLEQTVREKMLGLPRTTTFEWHQGISGTAQAVSDELQLPPYTPRDDEGK